MPSSASTRSARCRTRASSPLERPTPASADRKPDRRCGWAPASTFSRTVRPGKRPTPWRVRAIPSLARSCGRWRRNGRPSKLMVPDAGRTKPQITLNSVVFPAPLGPISPTISPLRTRSDTRSRATSAPNDTLTSSTLSSVASRSVIALRRRAARWSSTDRYALLRRPSTRLYLAGWPSGVHSWSRARPPGSPARRGRLAAAWLPTACPLRGRTGSGEVLAAEYPRDRGVLEDGVDGIRDDPSDREDLELVEAQVRVDREGVGHHDTRDRGCLEPVAGRIRQQAMGGHGPDLRCPGLAQELGSGADGPRGVDHVVDQHAVAAGYVTHHVAGLDLVRRTARPGLVDQRQLAAEVLAVALGHLHPAGVGCYDHHVAVDALAQVALEHRRCGQVVEGDVEESLDLARVKVDAHHPVGPGDRQQVGHELGGDRLATGRLAVLAGVAVVGAHRGDALG